MSKGLKIFLIIILVLSALVDALWLTIYFVAPDKVSMKTFNVSGLTGTQDSDGEKIPIIEVNVFDNCLETKFNYFCNTDSSEVYSTGVQQLISDNKVTEPVLVNSKRRGFLWMYEDCFQAYKLCGNVYYYNTDNSVSFKATNSLADKEGFYISIGEDRYFMSFKNTYKYIARKKGILLEKSYYYVKLDVNYFLKQLYSSVMNIDNFTSGRITFEFGDLFDYYKETSAGVFEKDPVSEQENEKILRQMVSYYNIKVNVHKGNIQRAEQSLFGQVGFNSNYYTGEIKTTDYYIGKPCYVLNEYDFEYVYISDNGYNLKVKDSALNYVKSLGDINIKVKINLDNLKSKNIRVRTIEDTSAKLLNVDSIELIETIDGVVTTTFVSSIPGGRPNV